MASKWLLRDLPAPRAAIQTSVVLRRNLYVLVAVARTVHEERRICSCLGLESAHPFPGFGFRVARRGHDDDLLPALDVLDERPAPLPWECVKPVVFQAERLACITASSTAPAPVAPVAPAS
jgi:hypothetical protein